MYAYMTQAYLSEHRVKPIHHSSVRKGEACESYGSGLVSNQVLTTTRREKWNEESKVESQTLYRILLLSNWSSNTSESDSDQRFFGEFGELAEFAPYDDSLEPSLPKRKPLQTMQEWIKKPCK